MIRTHKDNPMMSILIRDRREDTEMGKRNVTREAEIRAMWPEAEIRRSKDSPLQLLKLPFDGGWPYRHLDFRLLGSRTVKERFCFKSPSLWSSDLCTLGH